MTLDTEPDLEPIMGRIRHDAPSWQLDFDDEANAHTVWAYNAVRMVFCGNAGTFEAAWTVAAEQSGAKNLFILSVQPRQFQIMKYDPKMVSEAQWFARS
jgi:hypothetical protein